MFDQSEIKDEIFANNADLRGRYFHLCFPSKLISTLKGKNLLLLEQILPFKVDPFGRFVKQEITNVCLPLSGYSLFCKFKV